MSVAQKLVNSIVGWFTPSGAGTTAPPTLFPNAAGQKITYTTAMQLAAVWSCVGLISESIAMLPAGIYRRGQGGAKQYAPDHPLHLIVHARPNTKSTASQFWAAFVTSMLLQGNGFAEKLMIGNKLVGLRFLFPGRLNWSKQADGTYRWWYIYDDNVQREIQAARIWRVAGRTIDGDWGVSAIHYGAQVFGGAQAVNEAANKALDNGLMQTVAFTFPAGQRLTEEQRQGYRDDFAARNAGAANSGKPLVLENGSTVMPIGINPADAQLLQSRQWSRDEICAWFRVQPWQIGYSGTSTTSWGTGMETQRQSFIDLTLGPIIRQIEQSIDKDLLGPADATIYYSKFSTDAFLRADSAARSAFYDKMIKAGILTPDECRELEERAPMGGNAGKLMINSATVLVDDLGKRNAQANPLQQPPAGDNAPPADGGASGVPDGSSAASAAGV